MLSLRCIRPLLVVFFIYKVSAQWPVAPQPPPAYRWLEGADWWSDTRRSPRQSPIADNGSGNTLAATELIAEALEAMPPNDLGGKDNTARAAMGWFRFWLKNQQQRQQEQYRPKQQQQLRRQQEDNLESDGMPKLGIEVMAQRSRNGNEKENDVNSFEAIAADWRRGFATVPSMRINAQPGVATLKRSSLPIGEDSVRNTEPHYPYTLVQSDSDPSPSWKRATLRKYKRERWGTEAKGSAFVPSISTGAMAHLGTFFKDLTKNVIFTEQSKLGESQKKLLAGVHPLKTLQEEIDRDHETMTSTNKTAAFLHAIRSYRPSQKIRSLVSMTPRGYHGSQFIDPNYMWLGLGK